MDNDTMESTHDRDIWSEGFKDRLVDMLYEDTLMDRLRGGRITNGDNVRFATQMSAVCHKKFNSKQVKGKIARLKRKQREFTDLMKQTGLGWDPERKAPIASEEHWANTLRVLRSSWKNFKTWGCPRYEQLCAIFGCAPITDNDGGPSTHVHRQSPTLFSASYTSGSHRRQRGGPTMDEGLQTQMIDTLEEIRRSAEARREAAMEVMESSRSKKRSKGDHSMESDGAFDPQMHCMKLLEDVQPPLSTEQFNKCFDRLLLTKVQRSFVSISEDRRSKWAWSLK
ncbi:hypothetical protein I3842_05G183900 [Carya illinoinensis]|uniref:Myb/SANT-like domain-containing protein n=1 Tax=Carya illinoinensis TaxID=32201 RepID=A0A922F0X5_CARIL|nr:hypothetical protein I3842_05G183900 [Carya illinoinensis]